MVYHQFHYPDCTLMTLADRIGVCNCEELYDWEHANEKRKFPRWFALKKKIQFKKIYL